MTTTPLATSAGGQLTDQQREYNARTGAVRALVERAVANLKTWRILHTYEDALHAAGGLHWFTTR